MKVFRVWFEENGDYEYQEFLNIDKATTFYMEKVNNRSESVELEVFENLLSYTRK